MSLAAAEDRSMLMMTHVGLDGRWLRVTHRLCDLLGYSEEELLSGRFQLTHPDDLETDWACYQRLLRGEQKALELEKRYIHKNGGTVWVYLTCSLVTDERGAPLHFLLFILDITERKRAEEALRQSEERFRSIFENVGVGVAIATVEGENLRMNPSVLSMLGYSEEELRQLKFTDYTYAEDLDADLQLYEELLAGRRKSYRMEKRYIRKDGQIIWVRLTVSPFRNARDEIEYIITSTEDVTARKQAEEELARANAEIQALNNQLKAENRRMSMQLEIAQHLQQTILPRQEELDQILDLEIASFMQPAEEVGGDYYDVLAQGDRVHIAIGDVTGHGLDSGMLMLMLQTAVRTLAISQENDLPRSLSIINRTLYENAKRMQSLKNATLLLLDYHQGRLRLCGQHEQVIVLRANGNLEQIDTLELGLPLGLVADIDEFTAQFEIELQPEDTIVLYTDGITEAENIDGNQYGLERLCTVISEHAKQSTEEVKQAILADLYQHIGNQKISDDITLVIVKRMLVGVEADIKDMNYES